MLTRFFLVFCLASIAISAPVAPAFTVERDLCKARDAYQCQFNPSCGCDPLKDFIPAEGGGLGGGLLIPVSPINDPDDRCRERDAYLCQFNTRCGCDPMGDYIPAEGSGRGGEPQEMSGSENESEGEGEGEGEGPGEPQ